MHTPCGFGGKCGGALGFGFLEFLGFGLGLAVLCLVLVLTVWIHVFV